MSTNRTFTDEEEFVLTKALLRYRTTCPLDEVAVVNSILSDGWERHTKPRTYFVSVPPMRIVAASPEEAERIADQRLDAGEHDYEIEEVSNG